MPNNDRKRLAKPFRANLRAVWREFKRCSEMYLPLYHEFLYCSARDGEGPLTKDEWENFIVANPESIDPDANWWMWNRMPPVFGMGRFWGCLDGLYEFKMLAESAAIVFDEMELPITSRCFLGWLQFVHELSWGNQPPLLLSTHCVWDGVYHSLPSDSDEHVSKWHCTPDGAGDYPLHPYRLMLKHSVFTASMTLIEAVLDPESTLITSDALDEEFPAFLLVPVREAPDEETTVSPPELPINVPPGKNVFRKVSGKSWVIQFVEGCIEPESGVVDGVEGFYLIQKVLTSEKQPVSPIDLYAAIPEKGIELAEADDKLRRARKDADDEGMPRRRSGSGTGVFDMADPEAITNYRNRRKELLALIEQAQPNVKSKELDDAQRELDFINKELTSVTNLKGKPRNFPLGTPEEAARHRVKTSWSRALKLLRESKKFDKLSEFLDLYLKTQGAQGRQYMKAGEVKWET